MHLIRKKKLEMREEFKDMFLHDLQSIKNLSREDFADFASRKEKFEEDALRQYPCIVTTVGTAASRGIMSRHFKRVVMDEATMIKEHEAFLATLHAEQIVLVGDQNQMGPAYGFRVSGPSSLFSRLIEAGHPYTFLDTQYRMHESLM